MPDCEMCDGEDGQAVARVVIKDYDGGTFKVYVCRQCLIDHTDAIVKRTNELGERQMTWMIQYVEPAKTPAEAQAMLDAMRLQDGFVGGRVLPAGAGKPDRMQAFFDPQPDCAMMTFSWLPDGMRRVLVPDSQRKALGLPPVVSREVVALDFLAGEAL